jgi:hypothetical protein
MEDDINEVLNMLINGTRNLSAKTANHDRTIQELLF